MVRREILRRLDKGGETLQPSTLRCRRFLLFAVSKPPFCASAIRPQPFSVLRAEEHRWGPGDASPHVMSVEILRFHPSRDSIAYRRRQWAMSACQRSRSSNSADCLPYQRDASSSCFVATILRFARSSLCSAARLGAQFFCYVFRLEM